MTFFPLTLRHPGLRRAHAILLRLFLVLLLAPPLIPSHAQADVHAAPDTPTDNPYLAELIAAALSQNLHDRPEWRTLLHYQPRLRVLAPRSLADSPDFFFAPDGATNSRGELVATLTAFFSGPIEETDQRQHPQCRFVARYHWLKNALNFDPTRLPQQPCPRFEAWHRALDPRGVTLVFPAAYLNNPASMYGHTLLRVDQRGGSSQLLGHAINYAADTNETSGLVFAVRGLTGGYAGNFSVSPYYAKVGEYNDLENRDVWEYELTLNQEETDRLLMHAWELGGVRFDYYFLDENCSYHLLALLDTARPGLQLTDHFPLWVIPGDTVQAVVAQPGLVRQVSYRPARSTQIQHRLSQMPPALVRTAQGLATPGTPLDDPQLATLPADQQAQVLDLAFEYLEYRRLRGDVPNAQAGPQLHRLLVARSKIDAPDQPGVPMPTLRPEHGHGSSLISVGAGSEDGRAYQVLRWRPAYHDLLDPEAGYLPGAQIEFMKFELRRDNATEDVRLQQLTFASIVSLAPRDELLKPWSWRLDAGARRIDTVDGRQPLVAHLDLGAGLAARSDGGTQGYLMGEGSLLAAGALTENHALGAGASAGVLVDLSPRWRVHLRGRGLSYFSGERHDRLEFMLDQRYTLSRDLALRLETSWRDDRYEAGTRADGERRREVGSAAVYLDLHF